MNPYCISESEDILKIFLLDFFQKNHFNETARTFYMEGLPEIADPPIETAKGFLHEWWSSQWLAQYLHIPDTISVKDEIENYKQPKQIKLNEEDNNTISNLIFGNQQYANDHKIINSEDNILENINKILPVNFEQKPQYFDLPEQNGNILKNDDNLIGLDYLSTMDNSPPEDQPKLLPVFETQQKREYKKRKKTIDIVAPSLDLHNNNKQTHNTNQSQNCDINMDSSGSKVQLLESLLGAIQHQEDDDYKNSQKKSKSSINRSSKYRGVSRNGNQWQAIIMVENKKRYVGSFPTEADAARAYDIAALQNHGPKVHFFSKLLKKIKFIEKISKAKMNFTYDENQIQKIKNSQPILQKQKKQKQQFTDIIIPEQDQYFSQKLNFS